MFYIGLYLGLLYPVTVALALYISRSGSQLLAKFSLNKDTVGTGIIIFPFNPNSTLGNCLDITKNAYYLEQLHIRIL